MAFKFEINSAAPGKNSPGAPAVLEPETATTVKLTPRYRVLIHNDDKTPMDVVVEVLQEIFKKDIHEAVQIMLAAHHTGVALVVVLPLEEAELRVEQAHAMARARHFPLTFTYEPE